MNDLDTMRASALQKIDSAERNFKLAFFGAILFESFFLLSVLWFANFKDPLHLLILSCTGLIYMPVILGLVALGAHVNRVTLRVLARLDER
ncbi:MAG TPA: hypothetical protein VHW00_15975 [Thermoanaerobaculia bacterium]|nr:hypothetical protein [Thermoanaerobaculia bacterium]